MTFKTLDDLSNITGKRVLVRVDLNVPMKDGVVSDATRIEAIAPTVRELSDRGAKVGLLAHFGRPKGQVVPDMSLERIVSAVSHVLGKPVTFVRSTIGDEAAQALTGLPDGGIALLENTRFHGGEEKNDAEFAKGLAALGDIYVNDAFSAAHRAHASTEGVAHLLPAYAGRLLETELNALQSALGSPERPVLAVVGGAKVSTKIDLLQNLVSKVDTLVIGGGMANTFLAADGVDVGRSLCEHDLADTVKRIQQAAQDAGCTILLPEDVVAATEFAANADSLTIPATETPSDRMILDAGPKAIDSIKAAIDQSKTLLWNGPLGAFEIEPFDRATVAAARHAAAQTEAGALNSVAGGGDTVAALNTAGVSDKFSYVSTAGGAFLEWLEGKTLPGVAVLMDA